jgi:uncharacterized protein (DUF302 family)
MDEEMYMNEFEYIVTSNKTFPEAVEAVEKKTTEMGFRVLHTHALAARGKGISPRAAEAH